MQRWKPSSWSMGMNFVRLSMSRNESCSTSLQESYHATPLSNGLSNTPFPHNSSLCNSHSTELHWPIGLASLSEFVDVFAEGWAEGRSQDGFAVLSDAGFGLSDLFF